MNLASAQSESQGANQLQAPPAAVQQDAASATAPPDAPEEGGQTFISPNLRSVSVNKKLPPRSPKEKFWQTTQDSFDYSTVISWELLQESAKPRTQFPEFHQGSAGYGRYYWNTVADQADENYWVEFLFPVALHQDSRYYTLGRGVSEASELRLHPHRDHSAGQRRRDLQRLRGRRSRRLGQHLESLLSQPRTDLDKNRSTLGVKRGSGWGYLPGQRVLA